MEGKSYAAASAKTVYFLFWPSTIVRFLLFALSFIVNKLLGMQYTYSHKTTKCELALQKHETV